MSYCVCRAAWPRRRTLFETLMLQEPYLNDSRDLPHCAVASQSIRDMEWELLKRE